MTYLTMTISLIINHNHPYICWKRVLSIIINNFILKSHRQRRQLLPNWTQKWHTWQYTNVDNSRKTGMLGSSINTKISHRMHHLNILNKLKKIAYFSLSNELPSPAFTYLPKANRVWDNCSVQSTKTLPSNIDKEVL